MELKEKKIIIAEDDPELKELYEEFLSKEYLILIFATGAAALTAFEKTADDVCLLIVDYNLPDMTGLEVLKAIKSRNASVPVLFITGYGNEAVAVSAFRAGAKDYIKKPFTIDELIKKVVFLSSMKTIAQVQEKRSVRTEDSDPLPNKLLFDISISCKSENMHKALHFIDTRYKEKMNLGAVASIAGLSKYHFSRTFKDSTGITYQDYVMSLRVERAKEMLKSGKYSVTETAFSVGFSDLTHFGRIFKKKVGSTPLQYKKDHKAEQPPLTAKSERYAR